MPIFFTLLGIFVFLQPEINLFVDVSIMALQLPVLLYFELPLATDIDVNPLQLENGLVLIKFTLAGIVIEVKLLQPEKAASPIVWTPSARLRVFAPEQPEKA